MIDLFGLDRGAAQEPPPSDPQEPASRGSHRLWAFLLVLDSIFVIVFGGAVAAKVYQYWRAPSAPTPAAAARRRPAPKTAETPKPAEPLPAPAPAPAPVAAKPAAAKPSASVKAPQQTEAVKHAEAAPRPPKPSMLTEAPKPRSTPSLATSAAAGAAASAAAPSASASTKAQPVVFKIRAGNAKAVQLVGAFIVHGGRKEMTDADGVWSVKLYLNRGQYRYFFAVDKKKTLDPENPRSDRGASLLTVP
jgi:outer membrane biosynthesis protein TonB